MKKISAIFSSIENQDAKWWQVLLAYPFLLLIRLALEFWSSHRLFDWGDFSSIGLWFISISASFILLLQLFSGRETGSIIKVVVTLFPLTWSAPLMDLVISGGEGLRMSYVTVNNWQDAIEAFLTIGGREIFRGITPGIRIEILGLLTLAMLYIRYSGKNRLISAAGAFTLYVALFFAAIFNSGIARVLTYNEINWNIQPAADELYLMVFTMLVILILVRRHLSANILVVLKACLLLLPMAAGAAMAFLFEPGNSRELSLIPLALLALLWIPAAAMLAASREKYASGMLLALAAGLGPAGFFWFFFGTLLLGITLLMFQQPFRLARFRAGRALGYGSLAAFAATAGFALAGPPMVAIPFWFLLPLFAAVSLAAFFLSPKSPPA